METNSCKHKTWWDEKEEVIKHQVSGPYSEQDADELLKETAEIKQRFHAKKLRALLDLSGAGKVTSEARKMIAEKVYQDPDLEKIASFGLSSFARVVNSFMLKATGVSGDKVRVFDTEENALKWLKEGE